VGPFAQVDERAVLVGRGRRKRHGRLPGSGGQIVEDLDLERLVASLEEGSSFIERDLLANERVISGN